MDPTLAVTITDIEVAIPCHCNVCGFVEIWTRINIWKVWDTKCPEYLAVEGCLHNDMAHIVCEVKIFILSLSIQEHPMSPICELLTPRLDEAPFSVKDDDCVFALIVDVDAVLGVDNNPVGVAKADSCRQSPPAFYDFINVRTASKTHIASSCQQKN
jgi:hypothetical protein